MPFASISVHNCDTCSMRDDLESMGYCLLALLCQKKGYWFDNQERDHKYYIKAKEDFINAKDVDPRVRGVQLYLKQVKTLYFQ
jgi:hypothetical protein